MPHVKPSSAPAWLCGIVVAVLACATLMLCDVSRSPDSAQDEKWPALIDRLLAVPIEMTDVSDLRFFAVPLGLALVLTVVAVWGGRHAPLGAGQSESPQTNQTLRELISRYWLEGLTLFALATATGSAFMNGTWEISRGYLFFLSSMLTWAIVVSRLVAWLNPRYLILGASIVAVVASVLSLWHRLVLGERYFQLPVGPVTVTAGLGILWGAMSIGWLAGRLIPPRVGEPLKRPAGIAIVWGGFVAFVSLMLMYFAARRGASLGLVAALSFIGGVLVWYRRPSRKTRAVVVGFVILVFLAGVAFVAQQSASIERVVSVPLKLRLLYYETMASMTLSEPLLGYGPDIFCCLMTTTLAPLRAETPHRLHGGVDFDAHNEWLQAIFEWGIPGGLAYTAIPVVVIVLVVLAWPKMKDPGLRAMLMGSAAGLLAVFVTELSSINLRYTIVAPWFWTVVGLAAGLLRPGDPGKESGNSGRAIRVGPFVRVAAAAGALALVSLSVMDFRAAREHAIGRSLMYSDDRAAVTHLEKSLGRFGANRWLSTRSYLANSLTNILRSAGRGADSSSQPAIPDDAREVGEEALIWWKKIYDRSPAYLDTGYKFAETQYLLGDIAGARKTLEEYLGRHKPYYKLAISFYLQLAELSPEQILHFVLRSLRHDRWDSILLAKVKEALAAPSVAASWPERVRTSREDIASRPVTEWKEPMAPEILRVEAFQEISAGNLAAAERTQLTAAEAYATLAEQDAPLRRMTQAEADAWYLAARFIFDLDPGNYQEAYRRIEKAERLATMGLRVDRLMEGGPNEPWVGGKVMPLEAPEHLRDLWRFSAQMYMTQKASPRHVSLRVTWSLPVALQRNPAAIHAELGNLAAELVQRYGALPESKRPASFGDLVRLAQQYGAAPR